MHMGSSPTITILISTPWWRSRNFKKLLTNHFPAANSRQVCHAKVSNRLEEEVALRIAVDELAIGETDRYFWGRTRKKGTDCSGDSLLGAIVIIEIGRK